MNIATAKDYYRLGLIEDVLVRAPWKEYQGWTIEFSFSGRVGNADPILRVARKSADGRSVAKEFARLDSAARELAEMGIQQFRVIQG